MTRETVLLEQTYRARSVLYVAGLIGALVLSVGATACAIGLTQRQGTSQFELAFLWGTAATAAFVAIGGTFELLRNGSWRLCLTDTTIRWSVGKKTTELMCADVQSIAASKSEACNSLSIFMADGSRRAVPQVCLSGDLYRFCQIVHTHVPHIQVTYNGNPVPEARAPFDSLSILRGDKKP